MAREDIKHKHRIIPGHMGGGTYAPDNVVMLTIPEHAEAHRMLYEQYGRWQDYVAWKTLSGVINKAEAIRMVHLSQIPSEKNKQATRLSNSKRTGNYWTEERRMK